MAVILRRQQQKTLTAVDLCFYIAGMEHTTHPAADILPLMVGQEFEDLVLNIRAHGLLEPIILHPDGSLLDGRNRERACARAGIEPRYETWRGELGTEAAYVISRNICRRHLTPGERASMAAQITNLKQGRRPNGPSGTFVPVSIPEAAEMFDVSERSIKRARAAEREEMKENEATGRRDKTGRRLPSAEKQAAKAAQAREKAKHINAMMGAIATLAQLPDPTDLVAVAAQQRETIKRHLPDALAWLELFQEKWNEYHDK